MATEINLGSKTMSVWSIVAIVGGLLAFIALFLSWVKIGVTWEAGDIDATLKISGLDLLGKKFTQDGEVINDVEYSFVRILPLIIGILGILYIVTSVLPTFIEKKKEMAIASTVLAVIALILVIIFFIVGLKSSLFTGDTKDAFETMAEYFTIKYSAQVGLILALIGSIAGVVGGALNLKESL